MTVHFIGAGPGAPDLLTLRGRDIIAACPVCLYAGSLVPEAILAHCPTDAQIVNTAAMSLDEIIAQIETAHARGQDVARLHSGDLSVWSAMGEQIRRLKALDIPISVTPWRSRLCGRRSLSRGGTYPSWAGPIGGSDPNARARLVYARR